MVFCEKFKQDKEGLDKTPFPGSLGQKVYEHISKEAWEGWLGHQTMLINEYRLNLLDPKSRRFLTTEMESYLFGEGSAAPEGFTPT